MRISAAVTESKGQAFAVQELELGEPRPDEVLVRVEAAGICHTDLIVRDQWLPVPLPAVLGHEGAAVVEQVGSLVTEVAPGDRVSMTFMKLWEQGRFPVERLITTYDFDRINEAVEAAEAGTVVKPVLLMH